MYAIPSIFRGNIYGTTLVSNSSQKYYGKRNCNSREGTINTTHLNTEISHETTAQNTFFFFFIQIYTQ